MNVFKQMLKMILANNNSLVFVFRKMSIWTLNNRYVDVNKHIPRAPNFKQLQTFTIT